MDTVGGDVGAESRGRGDVVVDLDEARRRAGVASGNTHDEEVMQVDPNVAIAREILSRRLAESKKPLTELYETHQQDISVDEVSFKTDKHSVNVLYLSELLLGHQHSAVDFLINTVEKLKEMPEEKKPDVIVLSGLLQGDFKFLEKRRRTTLVPELTSMGEQFRRGKEIIGMMLETGIPVIYNMSNDDRRIAEDYTVEVFRLMHKYAGKARQDGEDEISKELARGVINYAGIDKMRQNSQWNKHLEFQIGVVFPYCLRAGRRLHTAEEMARMSGGEVEIEEYFMLFDAHERLSTGKKLTDMQRKWLEVDNMRTGKKLRSGDLVITDDLDLTLKTAGREYTDKIRHNLGFSQQPMYANHMRVPVDAIEQMRADGVAKHDFTVTQHAQEAVGVEIGDGGWVISTGGLIRARNFFDTRGSKVDVQGDISRRLITTRGRVPNPSATAHERTDDGRHIVTIFNKDQIDRSSSLPERLAIVLNCDWQIGSITCRPDYQVKFMDYVFRRTMQEGPVAIFVGGDIVHGRNYPDFPSESQSTGLMSMESQIEFAKRMIVDVLEGLNKDQVASIKKVIVEPGNHEWNSGTEKWHGYSFTEYLRDAYSGMFTRSGYTRAQTEELVKFANAMITPKGEFFRSWTGLEYFGANGVSVQHFALARGAKGNLGGLPVYQAHTHSAGVGSLKESITYELYGHWHHPQYAVFGDKLAVVGGSLAGISGYEWWRGYRPVISGAVLHIGGGLPAQIEFVSEEALIKHRIKDGKFSEANLKAEGYKTDTDFDPVKHGPFLPRNFPKSDLQKVLRDMMKDASEGRHTSAVIRARKVA